MDAVNHGDSGLINESYLTDSCMCSPVLPRVHFIAHDHDLPIEIKSIGMTMLGTSLIFC